MLVLILFVALIAYIWRFQYQSIRKLVYAFKIVGPPALPIIGNGLLLINKTPAEFYTILIRLIKEYGGLFRLWIGPNLTIVVSDSKDVEIIMTSTRFIDKSPEYGFMKPWLNDGLLLSTGKKWHNRRKVITPAFHFNTLKQFVEVFDRVGNTVVQKLNKFDSRDEVELYPIITLYALDVICETAMGVSIDALSQPDSEYVKAVKDISRIVQLRAFDFINRIPFFFQFSKLAKLQASTLNILHSFTDQVINKRRKELAENGLNLHSTEDDDEQMGIQKKRAFLDILLHSTIDGKPLDDLDIREEVDTFMFEGHDTTTSAITFCLYSIAKHPRVQEKCLKEIIEVLGTDKNEPTTLMNLNQLSYLEITIKETLRLYPSVPVVGRHAMEDLKLTKNRVIPAGASVLLPLFALSRDENVFTDVDAFIPERFLEERSREKQNPFSNIPFSAGPRNCIGQKFAMYELKSILSKIIRNFELTLTKDSEGPPVLSVELVLRPENTIKFYLRRRS